MASDIPIELKHLHTLLALKRTGSLTRAAMALHVTQSALSQQIKFLEDHYGITLFLRKTSPVIFTPAGKRLLQLAEHVVPALQAADRDLYQFADGQRGVLRVTLECHTCYEWLMPVMDAFRKKWHDVEVEIVSGFQSDPVGLLLQDRADVAIVDEVEETENLVHHHLFEYEMLGVLPVNHPLAARPWLEAEDFADKTLITYAVPEERIDVIRKLLKPAGMAVRRKTTELTMAIVQQVASERGIATLPVWAVANYAQKGYVTTLPITEHGLFSDIWLAALPEKSGIDYVNDFVAIVREHHAGMRSH
ncbi:MAG TPA: LysR family transcriptional regulator [Pantoea sp.]|uniref:LysR family transcriptional regulator n=1 Tax=Pantoea piersonii TaxID=2364647 RepID=UPI000ED3F260|nr:LysR family transcriptional regulator [Pantoea piersonii]HCW98831.1 LysR family transcriptional regulator [Pantoea sp.]